VTGDRLFHGRTVEDAVTRGLAEMELRAEDVRVTVEDRGSRGFLGLGRREARVSIAPRVAITSVARAITGEVLRLMEIEANLTAVQDEESVEVRIECGEAEGLLIGRKGETLRALEHLIDRMTRRQAAVPRGQRIVLDVAGYRERRADRLRGVARELADKAERTGRKVMTEPLLPQERRIVHRALDEDGRVSTHVAGSGLGKRVVITPNRDADAGE
jgi:spoIIIJ-associated protein